MSKVYDADTVYVHEGTFVRIKQAVSTVLGNMSAVIEKFLFQTDSGEVLVSVKLLQPVRVKGEMIERADFWLSELYIPKE